MTAGDLVECADDRIELVPCQDPAERSHDRFGVVGRGACMLQDLTHSAGVEITIRLRMFENFQARIQRLVFEGESCITQWRDPADPGGFDVAVGSWLVLDFGHVGPVGWLVHAVVEELFVEDRLVLDTKDIVAVFTHNFAGMRFVESSSSRGALGRGSSHLVKLDNGW